ncbi:MAG: transcriptional regulator [Chitinophagales bacterium]|nr:transcriptional regulator [Chitinophagales bacterium]
MVICKSNHLGDHIKVRRKYLGLFQKDVAEIIGVSEDSVTYWENKRSEPQIRHYPKIIEFLGYNPHSTSAASLGCRVYQYRIKNGLSIKTLAAKLKINERTLASWEHGNNLPQSSKLDDLLKLI